MLFDRKSWVSTGHGWTLVMFVSYLEEPLGSINCSCVCTLVPRKRDSKLKSTLISYYHLPSSSHVLKVPSPADTCGTMTRRYISSSNCLLELSEPGLIGGEELFCGGVPEVLIYARTGCVMRSPPARWSCAN